MAESPITRRQALRTATRDLWRNVRPKLYVRSLGADAVRLALVCAPAPVAMGLSDSLLRPLVTPRVSRQALATLFPQLSGLEVLRLEREIGTQLGRSRLAQGYARYGQLHKLREIMRLSGLERLRAGPAILLSWHVAVHRILGAVLRDEGFKSLVLTSMELSHGEVAFIATRDSLVRRAAMTARALARLREGGLVLIAGDGGVGETGSRAPVLGRHPVIRPGAAALARLSGVPVLPITATWEGRRIHCQVHDPLFLPEADPREAFQERAAVVFGGWLDRHLREAPQGLTPHMVDWLLEAPVVR